MPSPSLPGRLRCGRQSQLGRRTLWGISSTCKNSDSLGTLEHTIFRREHTIFRRSGVSDQPRSWPPANGWADIGRLWAVPAELLAAQRPDNLDSGGAQGWHQRGHGGREEKNGGPGGEHEGIVRIQAEQLALNVAS